MTAASSGRDGRDGWQRSRSFLSAWERPVGSPREAIETARDAEDLTPRATCAAANLTALHLARSGRLEQARGLLDDQVAASRHNEDVLIWTLDARVNLARLDAIAGDRASALARYRQLMDLVAWEGKETGLGFGRAELTASAPDRIELVAALRALRNGLAGDLCRLHWRAGALDELGDLARDLRRRWPTATGAGRTFPVEALLLLDPSVTQEALPDSEPDDMVVRLLHHASYAVDRDLDSADPMLDWAEESIGEHLRGCAGCSSCVDWLLDLAGTGTRAGRVTNRWVDEAVQAATALSDHAGLTRLRALVAPEAREGVVAALDAITPDERLLDESSADLARRMRELVA